jgi:hypothetical protein
MKEYTGTITKVISGWDRLIAFEVETEIGLIKTEFCNPPTTPDIGQKAKVVQTDGGIWELHDWWD